MAQIVYFKNLVNTEITKLAKLCDKWNEIFSKGDAPEEEKGNILAVIGQTRLLTKQKFKQFTNLIQQCEKNDSSQKITLDDLQGFWDLLCIQIEDMNDKFSKLELKEANKWLPIAEEPIENNNEIVKTPPRTTLSNKASKEAAKLRLNAAKAAMQERLKQKQN